MIRTRTHATLFALSVAAAFSCAACGSSSASTAVPDPASAAPVADASTPSGATSLPADASTSAADGGRSVSDGSAPEAAVSRACSGKSIPTRDDTWMLTFGADTRTFAVHVPATYDPTVPMPVVLNFHGFNSNAPQEISLSHMNAKADAAGFVVIYPEGTGTQQSWNAGACCGDAASQKKDDVGLVGAILDKVQDRLCVDAKRVYATGMSNGGFMAHRLACEMSTRIAAVAPVAAVLGITACNPVRPVPVMHFHGTLDPIVPYLGSPLLGFPSAAETFDGWAKRESCTGSPIETYRKIDTHCATFATCAQGSEITLCTVDGGGHTWPGGMPVPVLGYTSPNLSATDAMWDFFVKHPLP